MSRQEQDAKHDKMITLMLINRELCVELFRLRHTGSDEQYLDERIESLLSQISETTGELVDELYWTLDAEAYNY